jgi:polyhydroxybutyrate depolymerase
MITPAPAPRALRSAAIATSFLLMIAACSSSNGGNGGSGGLGTGGHATGGHSTGGQSTGPRPNDPAITVDLQGRPYDLKVPAGYDPAKPAPLLLELHGFVLASEPAPWDDEEAANLFAPEADKRGIFLALPHATKDPGLNHYFWNATDACCDFDKLGTNDIGYIAAVIEDIQKQYNIDPKRIFAFGHSNGGFMVNRLACDLASKVAGVVSLAGAAYGDPSKCAASAPIAYLQVHGDADKTVSYTGGPPMGIAGLADAPGAVETTKDWAAKNRCKPTADTSGAPFDLVADISGAETQPTKYDGCEGNGHTELWTMKGGPHSPSFGPAWAPKVIDFLMAYPKP